MHRTFASDKTAEDIRERSHYEGNLSTSLTVAEIRRGLALLSKGARRQTLEEAFDHFLEQGFGRRVLPFSQSTAAVYAPIYAKRTQAGFGIGELDLLLAAIAAENNAHIATRNVSDFDQTGVKVINPWTDKS